MMSRKWQIALTAVLAAGLIGCGGSEETKLDGNVGAEPTGDAQVAGDASGGPAAAAFGFLDALRTGDDEKATILLTELARRETVDPEKGITPPASDTARFEVGAVEYLSNDGARVACTWTDVDDQGQQQTNELLCLVRREGETWRVAGMAYTAFPGEPPVLLNFEDREDLAQKRRLLWEEKRRRAGQAGFQAQRGENSENPIRR